MAGGEEFNLTEEFAEVDFHEKRLEKRFRKTLGSQSGQAAQTVPTFPHTRSERSVTGIPYSRLQIWPFVSFILAGRVMRMMSLANRVKVSGWTLPLPVES